MERSVNDRNKQWTKTLPPSNGRVKTGTAGQGGGGAIIWPRLPLKIPYKNLKRKSIEKKLTCFVCGFVLRFLKLLFYAKQHCFDLRETHYINSQPFFTIINFKCISSDSRSSIFHSFSQGSMPLDPLETSRLQHLGYCAPNLKLNYSAVPEEVLLRYLV